MADGDSPRRAALRFLQTREFAIVAALFAICSLIYYFGELVDFAGWTAVRWEFFYSVHDIHRLFFLVPIVYAGHRFRVRGALIVTIFTLAVFLPRALIVSPFPDPILRTVGFTVVAGLIGTFIGVIRNEFERRSYLEALLRGEKDRFLGILERMHDGVMIVDSDYKVRFTNSSMVRDFGKGVGAYCYDYLHRFDEPCDPMCRLPSVLKGGTERFEYSLPGGRTYEVISSALIDTATGQPLQLSTFRNITERKKLELELIELNNLKSELLSNVSHELRSPLTSIKGIISSLLQKDIELDDDTERMLLTGMSEETDRLASLVTKLLDMSKLEAGVWQPDKTGCYLPDIVDEVLERQKWIHKDHVFVPDVAPDVPEVYADSAQIRQVLMNLVENAVAYSEEASRIGIGVRVGDGEVEVTVSDEGVGIRPEDIERIFDKFYRGEQRRRRPGGTGLGLAISKGIVSNHGGRIWAESQAGCGSTFHFTLPLSTSDGE